MDPAERLERVGPLAALLTRVTPVALGLVVGGVVESRLVGRAVAAAGVAGVSVSDRGILLGLPFVLACGMGAAWVFAAPEIV